MKKQFIDRRKVWHKKKELKEVSGKARIGGGLGEGGLCSLDSTLKKLIFSLLPQAQLKAQEFSQYFSLNVTDGSILKVIVMKQDQNSEGVPQISVK